MYKRRGSNFINLNVLNPLDVPKWKISCKMGRTSIFLYIYSIHMDAMASDVPAAFAPTLSPEKEKIVRFLTYWKIHFHSQCWGMFALWQGLCPGLTYGQRFGIAFMDPVDSSTEDENSTQRETTENQSHSVVLISNPDPEVPLSGPHDDHDNGPAHAPQDESPSSKPKRWLVATCNGISVRLRTSQSWSWFGTGSSFNVLEH